MNKLNKIIVLLLATLAGAAFSQVEINDVNTDKISTKTFAVSQNMIVSSMLATSGRTEIDLAECEVSQSLSDKLFELDCTQLIEDTLGSKLTKSVIFRAEYERRFNDDACEYKGPVEYPAECYEDSYISQSANCYIVDVVVAVDSDLLRNSSGIGFYNDGQITYLPVDSLTKSEASTETTSIFELKSISKCWAGSMSSSLNWQAELKPFVYARNSNQLARFWENIDQNHTINEKKQSINN